MGRSRYRIHDQQAPHFLTCTVLNWLPVFTQPNMVSIILDALAFRQQERGWKVFGYVILENHIHLLVQADRLSEEIARFKSFTARQLIDYLKEHRAENVLQQLSFFRKNHKADRSYQFWQEGSHPQVVENYDVLRQKLEYIHRNPVQRGYVDEPVHWRYSSARNYAAIEGLIPVYTDWF